MSLPHAMAMLVPESFNEKNPISEDLKAFYEYHSILMEPWDGPAALLFSDGRYAGGMLDRNGLRPARYLITKNGMMVVASEVGVMDFEPDEIEEKGRLQPGKILLVDTEEGKIYYDGELKKQLAGAQFYRVWLANNRVELDELKSGRHVPHTVAGYDRMLRTFGYSREDIERIIAPMCIGSTEPVGSMGNDIPLAVLSEHPQLLFNYFRQQFAQVTNPPIDPIREELVMSLSEYIGAVGMNILLPSEAHCKMVRLPHPVLTNTQLDILCNIRYKGFHTVKLPILFDVHGGKAALQEASGSVRRRGRELHHPVRPRSGCRARSHSLTVGRKCRTPPFDFRTETCTDRPDYRKRGNPRGHARRPAAGLRSKCHQPLYGFCRTGQSGQAE